MGQSLGCGIFYFSMTTKERFLNRVWPLDGGCWIWMGNKQSHGYGRFFIKKKQHRAHRLSYELFIGSVDDKNVCHKCDNPICVNPSHLFLGTQENNAKDMVSKKRQSFGVKNSSAKLTEFDVYQIKELFNQGMSQAKIARMLLISETTVWSIIHNRIWRHV